MPVDQDDYDHLLEQLKWSHAIVSVLVEQEGGVVDISKTELDNYDLGGTVKVRETDDGLSYRIEVVPVAIDGEFEDLDY